MIEVLNKYHFTKTPLPKNAKRIDRPSPLGNPFSHLDSKIPGIIKVESREEAIARYRRWFVDQLQKSGPAKREFEKLVEEYNRTGQLKLVCCCREQPGKKVIPCHGDVIAAAVLFFASNGT